MLVEEKKAGKTPLTFSRHKGYQVTLQLLVNLVINSFRLRTYIISEN